MTSSSAGATHQGSNLVTAVVAGAVAGNVTVTGIETKDQLVSVIFHDPAAGGAGVSGLTDVTGEFNITADDTINNATGTDTSGGQLIVIYAAAADGGGDLNRS